MKRKLLRVAIIVAICLCTLSTAAYAAESQADITVNAVAAAHPGGELAISGTADYAEVIVKVMRPDQTVLYVDAVPVAADRRYSTAIKLPADALIGTYTIAAGRGTNVATTQVEVTAPVNSSRPESPGAVVPQPGTPPMKSDGKMIVVELDPAALHAITETIDGRVVTRIAVEGNKLEEAFAALEAQGSLSGQDAVRVILLSVKDAGDSVAVELPFSALAKGSEASADTIIAVQTESAFYRLPVRALDYAALAQQFGGSSDNANVLMRIGKLSGDAASKAEAAIRKLGATALSGIVEFTVAAASNGNEVALGDLDAERGVYLSGTVDSDRATAVFVHPETGAISFVPALFQEAGEGKTEVVIKRSGNGSYAVIAYSKTFDDIAPSHWARNAIHLLASKLLVNGVDESRFAPERTITRAEFTALLVRALGLSPDSQVGAAPPTDVNGEAWFSASVGAALNAGLVTGYRDGTFRPNAPISREEMAVMIARALRIAGQPAADLSSSAEQQLSRYKDAERVSGWAKEPLAQLVGASLLQGKSDGMIAPAAHASRAESAALLLRFMKYAQLLNN